ncbi:MAG: substrate-binding domain-containing protein [Bacteroidales bacterium]|nr:substrate-binding domain-containing protein [Bacteroidales bacterium]MDY2917458.1 substrate-binding domain-containing protein [Muribaculaceae bacterium]
MKKLILFPLLAGALLIGASGCEKQKTYRIGVSQCASDDWRSKANDEMLREAMLHEDVSVEIRSAEDNSARQVEDIRYFADNGFDLIIASPNEEEALTPIIKDVYERGIPVVLFDREINGDSYTSRIVSDNLGIGREAGTYALNLGHKLGRAPRAIELRGLPDCTPATKRHRGFTETFTAGGGIIAGSGVANWKKEDAVRVTDSLLELYPDIDIIYAHNDRMAIGASEVCQRRGIRDRVKIIGIDAAPKIGIAAVADSTIDATFLYPTEGHLILKTAIDILKGRPTQKDVSLPASSPVDLSNADILLLQDKSLQQETEKMRELKMRIDTYWEKHSAQTSLFYASIVILLLVIAILFMVLRAYWVHKRVQKELMHKNMLLEKQGEEEKKLNRQIAEATRSKLAFYTNVSHDLRTPLTLISEPVNQLVAAESLTPREHSLALLIQKNSRILLRLINQILDFRKLENGRLSLNLAEIDFTVAVKEWMESFREAARAHDIRLSLADSEPLTLAVDPEKMERIFFNIISNAIKYTPVGGAITVSYAVEGENLVMRFSDTGRGIAASEISRIFESFYQSADHGAAIGSGIGLSLVKAFVELHGGTISVESTPGVGSVFTVTIPVRHVDGPATTPAPLITDAEVVAELRRVGPVSDPAATTVAEPSAPVAQENLPVLLVIDDNADMRLLVKEILGDQYRIHEAADGRAGLAAAMRLVPDIIICDVMMPVMDGLECCRLIKEEVTTSHIPVLMLTACALDHQRVQGYDSGADAYLPKPFTAELLVSRCRNLIANRRRIRELWARPVAAPSSTAPESASPTPAADIDNRFYARFLDIFTAQMSNPELSIEEIASEMGLGHSQFYRKIKALTGYTPVELIRQLRLREGRRMLTATDKSISEIAYAVGFSSPAYFTKCYRAAFNETPSALRDKLG